ncbi:MULTISPECIES: rhomboid family intramembrane serine protease [Flavobacterium]|uniref:Rhomboid family intramembrane serine protease n=1 Tax=Flavobacterium keumense TaxID=1306518 RepID=A0ABY8N4K1_9FLAO|nr:MULTISPECIES: rhomboid family intramembrane serine protease [Flavobacterium]WGK94580.1 rhomboid family intramembrane serine protease [Flavobacterium keumense]
MSSILDDLKMQYQLGGVAFRLIFWNVLCFLVSLPFFYQFQLGVFNFPDWIVLTSDPSVLITKPWTLISYAFFHHGFGHLFFNMMVLHFSSMLFLTFFNSKQFIGLYLLSALFSGIAFVTGYYFLHLSSAMVGASGAIMAILVATTTYRPLMTIRLLFFGNVKLWHITMVILVLDFMQFRIENTGGHIAHLAGAFFGFIFIKLLQNGIDLSRILNNPFQKSRRAPFKKVHKNYPKSAPKPSSRIVVKDKTQQQIDEILDKISQSGYDCLTQEEKEFLFKAGK